MAAMDGDRVGRHERLGHAIRQHREHVGWTQDVLAEVSHLPQSQISHWERGLRSVPTIDDLAAIEDALGLTPGTLAVAAGYVHLPTTARQVLELDPNLTPERREIILDFYDTQTARSKVKARRGPRSV